MKRLRQFLVASLAVTGCIAPAIGGIAVDFEDGEGFGAGKDLASRPGWTVTQGATVQVTSEIAFQGEQCLEIRPSDPVPALQFELPDAPDAGIRFITASICPVASPIESAQTTLHLLGSELAFVREASGKIAIVALHGSEIEASHKTVTTSAEWDEHGGSKDWLSLMIRQDLTAGTWDLFVNGQPAVADQALGPASDRSRIVVFGDELEPTYIDSLRITTENPLFPDTDRDGMPDAYEVAHRLNRFVNDRLADRDGDGVGNFAEFIARTSPSSPGNAPVPRVLYVDNLAGDDSNAGTTPYTAEDDGPKASLKAAMAAAASGDVIVVMKGRGLYDEGSRGVRGKALTIRAVDPVKIK
jgi:hypothetical protein